MTYHIPLCPICGVLEIGTYDGATDFCSAQCEADYHEVSNHLADVEVEARIGYWMEWSTDVHVDLFGDPAHVDYLDNDPLFV